MSISLKDYGRNQKERKEYIHQGGLLLLDWKWASQSMMAV